MSRNTSIQRVGIRDSSDLRMEVSIISCYKYIGHIFRNGESCQTTSPSCTHRLYILRHHTTPSLIQTSHILLLAAGQGPWFLNEFTSQT